MLRRRGWKKGLLLLLTVVLLLNILALGAHAEEVPYASARSQTVRVLLSRLNLADRMDVSLSTDYLLTTEEGRRVHFRTGSELAFLLRDGTIYLYYENMALEAGGRITLERTAETGGFYLTNFPALYLGNLELHIENGSFRPVLSIHVEDYLLGVVPYEMGESFPMEALKAQAITARTYALRSQNPDEPYDVVDTTNDQVFKGYLPDNPLSEQAVRETRGICGFYKGKLAHCYYSASNGGQMELVQTVWPTDEDYGYYTFGEDPYDVENPLSMVRAFEIEKHPKREEHQALWKLIAQELEEVLKEQGWDTAPESIRVDEISRFDTAKPVADNDKRTTALQLTMRISGRTRQKAATIRLIDQDTEEISLFSDNAAAPTPFKTPEAAVQPTEQPSFLYGPFTPLDEEITIEIPIFPDAEKALGLDISPNFENEIWTVQAKEKSFVIESRRYGHGVGMSQRGAQWMAQKYEKTFRDILSFYYPGMKLMRYPEETPPVASAEEALLSTAGPAPSPTPRPTLMPLTLAPEKGQWLAEVTEISENSSLNLRAEPSLNAEIVMRLYRGQKLIVVETAAEEGWVRVKTDAAEGYVMSKYLSAIDRK